jgi:ADP-ribose pyrophosphatase YjhB (NUDIX family)
MTVWRPQPAIRMKVLGLAWRGPELLLAEVEDDAGWVKGFRPLGGGIEFGETREAALRREFAEELGCDIAIEGEWRAFENIYLHEGATGHEYLFITDIRLADAQLYARERIDFREDNGLVCRARWIAPTQLPPGAELYPIGFHALLASTLGE